jgi:hypothetical protein
MNALRWTLGIGASGIALYITSYPFVKDIHNGREAKSFIQKIGSMSNTNFSLSQLQQLKFEYRQNRLRLGGHHFTAKVDESISDLENSLIDRSVNDTDLQQELKRHYRV